MFRIKTGSALLVALALALSAGAAGAATQFTAVLDGTQAGTPSTATGSAVLVLNDAETEVAYTITFDNLVGTETLAHFHNAPPGVNGPAVESLPLGSPKAGTWAVTPAEVTELFEGNIYINIHTDLYPGGEIRGNVAFDTVPNAPDSWSGIKSLYR